MSTPAFINIRNWTATPVTIAVTDIDGMDNGQDLSLLNGFVAPGCLAPADAMLSIESSGLGTSTFNITATDANGKSLGTLAFTEGSSTYSVSASGNCQLVANYFNAAASASEAYINIVILPFVLDPATWMTQQTGLGQLALGNIATLSSHDAGTYGYQGSSVVADEVITQTLSIADQLQNGARYFDLRPGGSFDASMDPAALLAIPLYHSHGGYLCAAFSTMLSDIAAFAQANPEEIIYLALTHLDPQGSDPVVLPQLNNGNNTSDPVLVLAYITCYQVTQALQSYLLPNSISGSTLLSEVQQQQAGRNIVVFADFSGGTVPVAFGTGAGQIDIPAAADAFQLMANNPVNNWGAYSGDSDIDSLVAWVTQNIPTQQVPEWNMLQCQLTGSFGTLLSSLTTLANESNPSVQVVLDPAFNPLGGPSDVFQSTANLVLMDNVSSALVPWLVSINQAKLQANQAPSVVSTSNGLFALKRAAAGSMTWNVFASGDGQTWTLAGTPPIQSVAAGLGVSGDQLLIAYKEPGTTMIGVVTSADGASWSAGATVPPSVNTWQAPAVVSFNGTPMIFYRGSGDDFLWYTELTGGQWTNAVANNNGGVGASQPPAMVVFNQLLCMVYKGVPGDSRIFILRSADGTNWAGNPDAAPAPLVSPDATKPITTWMAPAAAVFNGALYVAWKGADNANVYLTSSTDGSNWSVPVPIAAISTGAAPALCVSGNQLYVVFEPLFENSKLQACESSDGSTWSNVIDIV